MPTSLLPASAAAFAPRSSPNVVLHRVEAWLTATLKRVNRVKRPLNNVGQHTRCLTETLSSTNALWNLCSIMLPKAPESELPKDDNPLVEALFNYQLSHMEAYVVHVDMVSQNEVAFKLTPETIETLVDYHKDVFSADTAASTWDWAEKEIQLKKLHEEFVQAANRFVFRTGVHALEGMEEEGAGELIGGRSDDAKAAIMGLFVPLLPPPPRIVDVVQATPLLPVPLSLKIGGIVRSTNPPAPVESWQVVPSSPSAASTCDSHQNLWASITMNDMHIPSPTPSLSPPLPSTEYTTAEYYSAPMTTAAMAPLLLPSMFLQQQCSTTAGMGGFGWNDRIVDFALPYGTTM
ncbi:conserved hypothetical protein [Uncinocarpus reesii 1704]|uniref:Uncharacterized protein n=1 Tax=Uncinocarpus reesii (strain UAMH 1704) TaxID=336963 RepID=C4JK83_UNCRE|nr:uncharacterized protein UREG_02040 [Uncinocarpus reesii 1704]EEP77191.1 conserved hypothetical protein [Uncinocarpus reesii 1704]